MQLVHRVMFTFRHYLLSGNAEALRRLVWRGIFCRWCWFIFQEVSEAAVKRPSMMPSIRHHTYTESLCLNVLCTTSCRLSCDQERELLALVIPSRWHWASSANKIHFISCVCCNSHLQNCARLAWTPGVKFAALFGCGGGL